MNDDEKDMAIRCAKERIASGSSKGTVKHGGGMERISLSEDLLETRGRQEIDLLALDEALEKLRAKDPQKAELIKLRFFAGLSNKQAAQILGLAESTARNQWNYAKTWLHVEMMRSASP